MKRTILASVVCLALVSCAPAQSASETTTPSSSPSERTAKASSPAPTSKLTERDWVKELVNIGYIPGSDGGKWLDERMKSDAQPFCNASLTSYGESSRARLAKQTEFESEVIMNSRVANLEVELGYFLKVLERYCPTRIAAFDTVLKLHPELGAPKGRS